ncbi:hypothetical protein KY317_04350 [Candidatus Woesearchaeota archaeon]|nr:hypothetical protein [Candidatus Woesearchaeota archaeon]
MFGIKLKSSAVLSSEIRKNSLKLRKMFSEIDRFSLKLEEMFKTLIEAKKELGRLDVRKVKLNELHPKMINLHEKREELVNRLNFSIGMHLKKFLSVLDAIAVKLKNITFEADTLFYREDRRLTNLGERIKSIKDIYLRHKLISVVNNIKETIKSVTLRILEASRLEEEKVMLYPSKGKLPARKLKEIQVETEGLGKISGEFDIDNMNAVKEVAEQIKKLKTIELDVLVLMSSVDRYHAKLRERIYLLRDDVAKKIIEDIKSSEQRFKGIKNKISKHTQKLFTSIKIIGEKRI